MRGQEAGRALWLVHGSRMALDMALLIHLGTHPAPIRGCYHQATARPGARAAPLGVSPPGA